MCIPNDSLVVRNSCLYFVIMDKGIMNPLQTHTERVDEGGRSGSCVHLFDCPFTRFHMFWGFCLCVTWLLVFFHFRGNFLYPREQKNLIAIFGPTATDD